MGTWGTGIFEDDHACDSVDEFMESSDAVQAFKNALEKTNNFEYLESDEATEAIVAAALIDCILNGTQYHYNEGQINDWVKSHKHLNVQGLKPMAVKALSVVLADNSELNELWQENEEEYPNWKQNIVELKDRLSS